jgi:hypothetical protein
VYGIGGLIANEGKLLLLLLRPREGWSMAKDATLSRRVVMTTRSWGKYKVK